MKQKNRRLDRPGPHRCEHTDQLDHNVNVRCVAIDDGLSVLEVVEIVVVRELSSAVEGTSPAWKVDVGDAIELLTVGGLKTFAEVVAIDMSVSATAAGSADKQGSSEQRSSI